MATFRERQLLNIPESFAFNVLPSQQATFTPVFPWCPPRTAVRFDLGSCGDLALPWDLVHMKVCVCLLRMGSPFPPVLWSSCAQAPLAFNARCSGALYPSGGSLHVWCGAQNSHSCRWVSLCEPVSFQSVALPTREVWGCLYREIAPPTSWCDLLFFFWSRVSFLRFLVHLGGDCSAFSCEFCCF